MTRIMIAAADGNLGNPTSGEPAGEPYGHVQVVPTRSHDWVMFKWFRLGATTGLVGRAPGIKESMISRVIWAKSRPTRNPSQSSSVGALGPPAARPAAGGLRGRHAVAPSIGRRRAVEARPGRSPGLRGAGAPASRLSSCFPLLPPEMSEMVARKGVSLSLPQTKLIS